MTAPVTRAVAIDGPSGSGKSTVARGVARALGWSYVDTGATYRAATLAVLDAGVDPRDPGSGGRTAGLVAELLDREGVALVTDPARPAVLLDGRDVGEQVRGPAVTAAVSAVSALPEVRTAIVALQRRVIGAGSCVVEGRDIGTVVLPHAAVKVFLDADVAVRAGRRAAERDPGVAGSPVTAPAGDLVAAVTDDLARRDRLDSARAASPLTAAADAVHVDTSQCTADEAVARVLALAHEAGLGPG